MSKITVLLFSTLLIVIMQSTSAFYYNITDHIMYRCTDLGEICHNHLPPCCGEERRLHTTPVIRCKQWSLLIPHEKRCQRMPNDYYMYFTDNDK